MRKLYFSGGSPFARKIRIVLAELRLDYEEDRWDTQRPFDTFGAINPAGRVPVLEDNGQILFDSQVIMDYLEEHYSSKLDDLRSDFIFSFRNQKYWELRKTAYLVDAILDATTAMRMLRIGDFDVEHLPFFERHATRIDHCLDWLEKAANHRGFVPGSFTPIDIGFICAAEFSAFISEHRLPGTSPMITLDTRPNLKAMAEHFSTRPSVRKTSPLQS